MSQNILADRLKELRTEKGLSQRALAEEIPVAKQTVSGYEKQGNVPDIEILMRIADYFGVSVDYLIGAVDVRTPITKIKTNELTSSENELIGNLRSLPPEVQENVKLLVAQFKKYRYPK
ncbi:helix-turn-helix domain-containing protein [Harryflintia acetispora]|uniref:helix-turn-helix domain-containing protein n=1 Tax=Harryflintia acetispora TaxID=1849041 RepID=UPI0018999BE2